MKAASDQNEQFLQTVRWGQLDHVPWALQEGWHCRELKTGIMMTIYSRTCNGSCCWSAFLQCFLPPLAHMIISIHSYPTHEEDQNNAWKESTASSLQTQCQTWQKLHEVKHSLNLVLQQSSSPWPLIQCKYIHVWMWCWRMSHVGKSMMLAYCLTSCPSRSPGWVLGMLCLLIPVQDRAPMTTTGLCPAQAIQHMKAKSTIHAQ